MKRYIVVETVQYPDSPVMSSENRFFSTKEEAENFIRSNLPDAGSDWDYTDEDAACYHYDIIDVLDDAEDECIEVETEAGMLRAYSSHSEDFPDITIKLLPKGSNVEISVAAAEVHQGKDKSGNFYEPDEYQDVFLYVWGDPSTDSCTHRIPIKRKDIERYVLPVVEKDEVKESLAFIKNTAFLGGPDTDTKLTKAVSVLEEELKRLRSAQSVFASYVENDLEATDREYCLDALEQSGADKELIKRLNLGFLIKEDKS